MIDRGIVSVYDISLCISGDGNIKFLNVLGGVFLVCVRGVINVSW